MQARDLDVTQEAAPGESTRFALQKLSPADAKKRVATSVVRESLPLSPGPSPRVSTSERQASGQRQLPNVGHTILPRRRGPLQLVMRTATSNELASHTCEARTYERGGCVLCVFCRPA